MHMSLLPLVAVDVRIFGYIYTTLVYFNQLR